MLFLVNKQDKAALSAASQCKGLVLGCNRCRQQPASSIHGEQQQHVSGLIEYNSFVSDYFVTVQMSVCANVIFLDFVWLFSLARRGWFPSSYCRPHSDALIFNRSERFSVICLRLIFPLMFDSWPSLGDDVSAVTWAHQCVAWVASVCRRRTTTRSLCCCRRLITVTTLLPVRSLPPHRHPKTRWVATPQPTLDLYGDGPDPDSTGSLTWHSGSHWCHKCHMTSLCLSHSDWL